MFSAECSRPCAACIRGMGRSDGNSSACIRAMGRSDGNM